MKLNRKGFVIEGSTLVLIGLTAIGILVGETNRQAGKWGTKDGVAGSESHYPVYHGTVVEILGPSWKI